MAKKSYLTKKRQSLKRNKELLRSIIASSRAKLATSATKRDKLAKLHDRSFKKRFAAQKGLHRQEI